VIRGIAKALQDVKKHHQLAYFRSIKEKEPLEEWEREQSHKVQREVQADRIIAQMRTEHLLGY
jgi:hypothetical protein